MQSERFSWLAPAIFEMAACKYASSLPTTTNPYPCRPLSLPLPPSSLVSCLRPHHVFDIRLYPDVCYCEIGLIISRKGRKIKKSSYRLDSSRAVKSTFVYKMYLFRVYLFIFSFFAFLFLFLLCIFYIHDGSRLILFKSNPVRNIDR